MRKTLFTCVATWLVAVPLLLNAQTPTLPDGPGKATTEKVCGACHGTEVVIGRQETREGWAAIVNEMVQRGAAGTDEELSSVLDYLAKNFSKASTVVKINVNKATAKDLENGLRLSEAQAGAVVHWREEKGDFKSVEDLERVPGVEAAKIEAAKDRLSFE
jgi:competence protein ComEA